VTLCVIGSSSLIIGVAAGVAIFVVVIVVVVVVVVVCFIRKAATKPTTKSKLDYCYDYTRPIFYTGILTTSLSRAADCYQAFGLNRWR